MASIRAATLILSEGFSQLILSPPTGAPDHTLIIRFRSQGQKLGSSACIRSAGRSWRRSTTVVCCSPAEVREKCEEEEYCGECKDEYLVKEFGWGVRRMVQVMEEMRRVAYVQAEAFHVPVVFFNDFFFDFFQAEVISALIYRIRNSPPDRYACLVAESFNETELQWNAFNEVVGVADVTVQRDDDVLKHLKTEDEYLYVSGIAVLTKFRRQKVATVLLKACDELSVSWGFNYLALRVYEDDAAARTLYSNAGYGVVSRDPFWVTWIGRKIRVLMVKQSPCANHLQAE